VRVAALLFVAYLLAARGAGNFYPLSTFPMYSGAGGSMSRIMARLDGKFLEVTALSSWKCDYLPQLDTTSCAGAGSIGYVDRERQAHIEAHSGEGGVPVELVRRVFSFDGVQRPEYCVITTCRARP
jgi:hypothetical protein